MKRHADAALRLNGRRELRRRVPEGERTLSEAVEAVEASEVDVPQAQAQFLSATDQ